MCLLCCGSLTPSSVCLLFVFNYASCPAVVRKWTLDLYLYDNDNGCGLEYLYAPPRCRQHSKFGRIPIGHRQESSYSFPSQSLVLLIIFELLTMLAQNIRSSSLGISRCHSLPQKRLRASDSSEPQQLVLDWRNCLNQLCRIENGSDFFTFQTRTTMKISDLNHQFL